MRIETFDKDVGFRQLSADMARSRRERRKKGKFQFSVLLCFVERGGTNRLLTHLCAFYN